MYLHVADVKHKLFDVLVGMASNVHSVVATKKRGMLVEITISTPTSE